MTNMEMATSTSRVTDTRYSVFIEIRERGHDSVVCKSALTLERHVKRGRPSRRPTILQSLSEPTRGINVIVDVAKGDYVEIFRTQATGTLSVRPAKIQNIMTPYVLTLASNVKPEHETFFATEAYAVVATLARRAQFTQDTFRLADTTQDPMHRISALKAMEQLFIAQIANNTIERAVAVKKYEVYDKLCGLIWHGATPGEQSAAFHRAWDVLAKVTGVRNEVNEKEDV